MISFNWVGRGISVLALNFKRKPRLIAANSAYNMTEIRNLASWQVMAMKQCILVSALNLADLVRSFLH